MKRIFACLIVLAVPLFALGQKKPLEHSDYDSWNRIYGRDLSHNGEWVAYTINPQEGDGWFYLYNIPEKELDSLERGGNAQFSHNSEILAFAIVPTHAETRQAKKDKKKADEMPKDNLGIWVLGQSQPQVIERVKSFKMPEKGGSWIAFLMEKKRKEKEEEEEEEEVEESEKEKSGRHKKQKGTRLVIMNPVDGALFEYEDVTDYTFSEDGSQLMFLQVVTDTSEVDHTTVSLFSTEDLTAQVIFTGEGNTDRLNMSDSGEKAAFIHTSDTGEVKIYDLYLWKEGADLAATAVTEETSGMPSGWSVSKNGNLSFSENEERLYLGTAESPQPEPEDTLLKEEKYRLDIWSWHDPLLQPQQKSQLNRLKTRNYRAVYHLKDKKFVQLADEEMPDVRLLKDGNADRAFGYSDIPYLKRSSWDASNYRDVYLVDVLTGKREVLLEKTASTASPSPDGNYLIYWDISDHEFYSLHIQSRKKVNLTAAIDVPLADELNDRPMESRPYGIEGWIEDEAYVIIEDRYDFWKVDPDGGEAPVNITRGYGRENHIDFNRVRLDREADYIGPREELLLSALDEDNKKSGFYRLNIRRAAEPEMIMMEDCAYSFYDKADQADVYMWSKQTFTQYPEIYISDDQFRNEVKVSLTNPQQSEYNWGTVELVEWESFNKDKLQGLLYKPEDFDPSKKYPMIVYFYERSSNGMHRYNTPAPSASVINRIHAVSNGYLIFVPDIPYRIGYPGQSCYNSVVSGTNALLERHSFIDRDRLGLDGQSWGGYQIAYLVTQTDMFACGFSGAPVSNMTSAYGGIRWASGMSRMFQYEQTQSRIGGTLWEKPVHYIENSPIFFMPKINTPLLIMHNDNDGAVPWYQGIEYFVSLRRLGKPAWMLSYNDESHNLRRRPNRKDLSIRKMQFFDHYLMDQPMPYWMKKGISQLEKGKIDGYKLMDE